ncbi:hypothetical protein CRV08_06655 [Halarcobacter ebronensis]|uniref:Beta-lactamase n=1 Tax=Halarcobacter ebronensis TaxID=1462615 RepID=A0A4Q0YFQ6_9BACT|nr:sel1 repeat family protein [Halarcobacter ebronensis]RXJ68504.1 hypothetical protein CRV08_06655 [Halarcobacter ebronensis]
MIHKLLKISLLLIITLSFSACEDKQSNHSQSKAQETKEVKFTPKLKIPEWDKITDKEIRNYYNNWHNSKHDPIPAMNIGYAYSEELHDYEKAFQWFKYANSMIPLGENSYFACYALQQLKRYDEAIKWCENAIELKWDKALFQLGTIYYDTKEYEKAIDTFIKAKDKGFKDSFANIALSYVELGDNLEAEQWFKKAIQQNDYRSYQTIATFYHKQLKDDIKASAYAIALIDTKYTKNSVIKLLKEDWQIPNETIKKGYELQLNSPEFPVKYRGKLDLE